MESYLTLEHLKTLRNGFVGYHKITQTLNGERFSGDDEDDYCYLQFLNCERKRPSEQYVNTESWPSRTLDTIKQRVSTTIII